MVYDVKRFKLKSYEIKQDILFSQTVRQNSVVIITLNFKSDDTHCLGPPQAASVFSYKELNTFCSEYIQESVVRK